MAESTEEEPAEAREHSFWSSFSQADLRLFLVTLAGTLVANIVTAVIVAVALIAARPKLSGRPTVGGVLLLVFFALTGLFFVGRGVVDFRRRRPRDVTMRVLTVAMGLLTVGILLVLLGYAVGVK